MFKIYRGWAKRLRLVSCSHYAVFSDADRRKADRHREYPQTRGGSAVRSSRTYRNFAKRLPEATFENFEVPWLNGFRPVRRVKVAA